MLTKALRGLKITDASEGRVEVVFATLNVKDFDGDVTLPGAFEKGAPVRISAYNHASWSGSLPVGKGVIDESDSEALFAGQFFMNTAHGRDTFETVKQMGDLQEWSYGYDVEDQEPGTKDGERVNLLKKVKTYEVSPVLVGAGVDTRTLAAKARSVVECAECKERKASPLFGGQGELKAVICSGCGHVHRVDAKQLDSDLEEEILDAGQAAYGTGTMYVYLFDHDVDDNFAVFCMYDTSDASYDTRFVQVPFTRNDDGTVTLNRAQEQYVEPTTSFVPEKAAPDASSRTQSDSPDGIKGVVSYTKTGTSDASWDGPGQVAKLDSPLSLSDVRGMFAWYDSSAVEDGELPKSAAKFPHHFGVGGSASTAACSATIANLNGGRGGASIPDSDRSGVYNHVAKHLTDAGEEPAELKAKWDPANLKLADHIAIAQWEVEDVSARLAEVVTKRAEIGNKLADGTRASVQALVDQLDAATKSLREVLTSAAAPASKSGESRLTLEDETRLVEVTARHGLTL